MKIVRSQYATQVPAMRPGSLLVEALIGITLFALFASATFLTLLTGQESTQTGSQRVHGVYYTEQALEVAKNIRDANFVHLAPGQYGYTLTSTGVWVLSGSNLDRNGYDTKLIVQNVDSDTVRVVARSAWKRGYNRSGATVLSMELTNWRTDDGIGDWSSITQASETTTPSVVNFNDIEVYKNYAYVTSNVGTYGDGLYIYDVSNISSPSRVSSAFSLSQSVQSVESYKNALFLGIDNNVAEIMSYDITIPTGLNGSTAAEDTYDVPGNSRVNAIFQKGDILYAGADGDASESEVYSFTITSTGSIELADSYDLSAYSNPTVNDIFARGDYLYLATDNDTYEMITLDISGTGGTLTGHTAWGATGAADGYAVRAYGTGFYLGRSNSSDNEYILVTGSGGSQSTNSYEADMGATVNAMDMDPLGCYAFLGTGNASKELQIRSARYKGVGEEASANITTGEVRGVHYDILNDRLFMASESGFYIYTPGVNGDCS